MLKMEDEIKGMAQETADELLKAIKEIAESEDVFVKQADSLLGGILENKKLSLCEEYVKLVTKAINSTFITRWWWMRKADKVFKQIKAFVDVHEELKRIRKENGI